MDQQDLKLLKIALLCIFLCSKMSTRIVFGVDTYFVRRNMSHKMVKNIHNKVNISLL